MKNMVIHGILAVVALIALIMPIKSWTGAATQSLTESFQKPSEPRAPTASLDDAGYCNSQLRPILRRVLTSCSLVKDSAGKSRGCAPLKAKVVANMSDSDFNALFKPLSQRAAIIQFDVGKADLDPSAIELIEKYFSDRGGASYFLVVSRASPDGPSGTNAELSQNRANAVLNHLKNRYPTMQVEIEEQVGLLSLGEEYAQLGVEFCEWTRSRPDAKCTKDDVNRSVFVSWIDCKL